MFNVPCALSGKRSAVFLSLKPVLTALGEKNVQTAWSPMEKQGVCHTATHFINSLICKMKYYFRRGAPSSKVIFSMDLHTAGVAQNVWNFLQEGERERILFFFVRLFKIFRFKIIFLNQIGKISSVLFSKFRRPAHVALGKLKKTHDVTSFKILYGLFIGLE